MTATDQKKSQRTRRHKRIRAKVIGTDKRPRLAVFKSNRHLYVQLVDDTTGNTLAAVDARSSKAKTPNERAKDIGKHIARKASELKIHEVVFDRGGYIYTGNIQAVADGAREGGLSF